MWHGKREALSLPSRPGGVASATCPSNAAERALRCGCGRAMFNEAGQPTNLEGRANGAVIEVVVDHSDGSLAFGVNGAPPRRMPNIWPTGYDPAEHPGEPRPAKVPFKFPQGAPLRPWALLGVADRVRFARGFL